MDKAFTHSLAEFHGIRQAGWECVRFSEYARVPEKFENRLETRFTYPMFVKPASTGSSVGVSKAADREQLRIALRAAARYGDRVLVEQFIDGREIEVAVLGDGEPVASVCGEIVPGAEFYTYEDKYVSNAAKLIIPAPLAPAAAEELRDTAVAVYKMTGCRGLARVDFFVTRDTGTVVFNEINTMPGFTSISMYPKLMQASGISYPALLDRLVDLTAGKR